MESKHQAELRCKRCGAMMTLLDVSPRVGARPESKRFQCKKCGLFDAVIGEPDIEYARGKSFEEVQAELDKDGIVENIFPILSDVVGLTNAGSVTTLASHIEKRLEELLLSRMRSLSRRLKVRMFDGYGPLSTFSAKSDFAYCLDLIDDTTYADIKILKNIRNEFAHSTERLTFASPRIRDLCKNLSTFSESIDDFPNAASLTIKKLTEAIRKRQS